MYDKRFGLAQTIKEHHERYTSLLHRVSQLLEAITRDLDHSEMRGVEEMKEKVKHLTGCDVLTSGSAFTHDDVTYQTTRRNPRRCAQANGA
jgi:hypothetical protein